MVKTVIICNLNQTQMFTNRNHSVAFFPQQCLYIFDDDVHVVDAGTTARGWVIVGRISLLSIKYKANQCCHVASDTNLRSLLDNRGFMFLVYMHTECHDLIQTQ